MKMPKFGIGFNSIGMEFIGNRLFAFSSFCWDSRLHFDNALDEWEKQGNGREDSWICIWPLIPSPSIPFFECAFPPQFWSIPPSNHWTAFRIHPSTSLAFGGRKIYCHPSAPEEEEQGFGIEDRNWNGIPFLENK
jgi:hypothetical protein